MSVVSTNTSLAEFLESPYRYSGALPPDRFNLTRYCLAESARRHPDKFALEVFTEGRSDVPSEQWRYRELEDAVLNLAGALQACGLTRGDRILIHLDNTSAFAFLFFAAIAAGYVPIPTSNQLSHDELTFLIADSEPSLIASAWPDKIQKPAKIDEIITPSIISQMMIDGPRIDYASTEANDPAYLIYTSGTTSRPKGVLHAHRAAWGRRPMYKGWYDLHEDDRVLHAGAFNWTYTLGTGLTDPWANHATAIVNTGGRTPDLWPKRLRASKATIFAAVPGVFRQVLKYSDIGENRAESQSTIRPFPYLRHGLIAGETPSPTLFDDWKAATGTELYEALGMSEISTYISSSPNSARKPGCIGKAQPGRSVAILPNDDTGAANGDANRPLPADNEGLLAVHRTDPGLMLGYWRRPEEESQVFSGEWFIGGDLARMDDDGFITHLGRANDIMNALGYRVSPQEIENVISNIEGVAEVACAEIQVRSDVSIITAFIVCKPGVALNKDAVHKHVNGHLAAYKLPREIVFVEALPRTANGKIQRAKLSDVYHSSQV